MTQPEAKTIITEDLLDAINYVDHTDPIALRELEHKVYEYYSGYKLDINSECPPYTTSRDELKALRPAGWRYHIRPEVDKDNPRQWKYVVFLSNDCKSFFTPILPTEELAELYAIIMSTHWEKV